MSRTYDLMALHTQAAPEETSKYFGLSMFVHVSLAAAAIFVTVPAVENLKKEAVTIEIIEPVKPITPVVRTLEAPKAETVQAINKSSGGAKAAEKLISPMPSAPIHAELSDKIKGPTAKSTKSVSHAAKIKTHTGSGIKPVRIAHTAPSRAGVPNTIEDIAAPDLNFDGVVAAQSGKLGDDEFEDAFKKVDKSNAAAVQAQKAELDNDMKQVSDEKDEALQALENDNQQQAKAMENSLKATRTKNAAIIAQLKASELAAAEKAAHDRDAKVAAAVAHAAAVGREQALKNGHGQGSESTGADQVGAGTAAAGGEPNGVRSLDQLRQVPGNPKPQYSVDERLRREQGMVAFYAYITKGGQPSKFRIMQSTGFRNLDGKTLMALKKWKFYPGQEGWVEIPFKWDIKGGVQEIPTLLRRSRYGSN
ncbi:MAG: TonB family protein [Pseudobdellovibrio sp.]